MSATNWAAAVVKEHQFSSSSGQSLICPSFYSTLNCLPGKIFNSAFYILPMFLSLHSFTWLSVMLPVNIFRHFVPLIICAFYFSNINQHFWFLSRCLCKWHLYLFLGHFTTRLPMTECYHSWFSNCMFNFFHSSFSLFWLLLSSLL